MAWLSRFVDNVHVVEVDGPRQITRMPDGRTNLIFRVYSGGGGGDLTVSGPRTRAFFKTATGIARWITVELKRGWSMQLLGVPASALTDRIVHLHDLWGRDGANLCDELLAARDVSYAVERISRAVAARTERTLDPASARLARRAVRMLESDDPIRITRLADRLGVTTRHLRRAFIENIGIGPKDFARAVRLQRVVEHVGDAPDWGRIAADAGYYDQAHLIADFRELVGVTPGAFARRSG
jgi:AraC-like DNA-binding protein